MWNNVSEKIERGECDMLLNNSLEKDTIKLSYKNQYKIGCIAERMGVTADQLVNTVFDLFTAYSSSPAKDLRFICKERIDEIEGRIGSMTPREAMPYLDDLEKYKFLDKFLEKTDVKAIIFSAKGEDELDDEEEDRIP